MRTATWNVNSVKARLARVLAWLEEFEPDVLCLQELKSTEESFPYEAIEGAGYHAAVHGQRTYNGVALLSRTPMEDVVTGMDDEDEAARLISGRLEGVTFLSAYFPNGRSVGSDAFAYKIRWMERLRAYLDEHLDPGDPVLLAGDFNVAPREHDVADPEKWSGSVLCVEESRKALERVRDWGFTDVFEKHHPEGGVYSWWDYRRLAFPRNDGLRIDHIFATSVLTDTSTGAFIDRDERKGKKTDKPSDHVPVVVDFEWP